MKCVAQMKIASESSSAFVSKCVKTEGKTVALSLERAAGSNSLCKWRNCICSPAGHFGAVKHLTHAPFCCSSSVFNMDSPFSRKFWHHLSSQKEVFGVFHWRAQALRAMGPPVSVPQN